MHKLLTLVALAAVVALGQITDAERRAKLPREIRDLIDQSPAAPPELAADILLRLVESGRITDKKIKAEMLEQAFVLAGAARYPMRLVIGVSGHTTDSDAGVRYAALANELDTLSLRSRAIREMLDVDRKRALDLFRSMPPLHIPVHGCSDAMVERVDEFYSTLAALVSRSFEAAEKREGKHWELAESYLHSMVAPAQLEPAGKMILALELGQKQLEPMLSAYSIALHEMPADDRAFSASTHADLLETLSRLAKDSENKGVSSYGLVDAFRAYLVRHMRGARCEENVDPSKGAGKRLQGIVESFNSNLRLIADPQGKQIRPIQPEDMQADKVEGRATVYEFWSKPGTEKLLMDLKHLRFGTPEQQAENDKKEPRPDGRHQFLTVEQRSTLAWQTEAREYLNEVESWNKDHDETEENYFHEVCFIYTPLLVLVPPGELWDNVLASYVSFLKQSVVEKDSPPEWYLEVSRLIRLDEADSAAQERVWQTMKSKGDIVMSMYVDLERLAETRAAR